MRKRILFFVLFVSALAFLFQLNAYAEPQRGGQRQGGKGDRDNNPSGPKGGPGTNWENPPGPKGGPGAGQDQAMSMTPPAVPPAPPAPVLTATEGAQAAAVTTGAMDQRLKDKAIVDEEWEKAADTNKDGVVDPFEARQWKKKHHKAPSGREKSVVDTGWERMADTNKDGMVDQTEIDQWHKRNKKDKDDNPPGPRGGRGTNWENPPGPKGGAGASPDRRR